MNHEVREARYSDASGIAHVHVRSWKDAYQGIVDQAYLETGLDIDERTQRWRENLSSHDQDKKTFIVLVEDHIVGFCVSGGGRDEGMEAFAEIYAMYVDPAYLRKGFGRALMKEAIDEARAGGFKKLYLWALAENTDGGLFYKSMGAELSGGQSRDKMIDGRAYPQCQYVWHDLKAA